MALNINGRMKVKTLKSEFKNEFGLTLRIYDGNKFADDDATLAAIRKGDSKGGEFSPKRNTRVGNLEDKILDMFGIKTKIAGSDDKYLFNKELTLAAAKEDDDKSMERKEKKASRGNKAEDTDEQKETVTNTNATESEDLTEEEKKWLDDLWNLDEAPEYVRANKRFMLSAVQEDASVLEHASDDLKNNKEIVVEAVKNDSQSLEYASEDLKSDSEIALLLIDLLNEDKMNTDSHVSFDSLCYLSPKVFTDEAVINKMAEVAPHEMISGILYRNDKSDEIFNTLEQFNNIFSPALQNEFEINISKAISLVENDETVREKLYKIEKALGIYDMENLIYSKDFELEKSQWEEVKNNGFIETALWNELKDRVRNEVFNPLNAQASSFDDYKGLINMVLLGYSNYKLYTYYPDEKDVLTALYAGLVTQLDKASVDDLMCAYLDEEYFSIQEVLPSIADNIMETIGEKLLNMDNEEMIETLNNFEDYNGSSKISDLSEDMKKNLLEKIESFSDDEKEEVYELDEIVENLK